tara:strand:- start:117 stop:599 length:483 start_codon:yes stop_codon:yes gene_type:complete
VHYRSCRRYRIHSHDDSADHGWRQYHDSVARGDCIQVGEKIEAVVRFDHALGISRDGHFQAQFKRLLLGDFCIEQQAVINFKPNMKFAVDLAAALGGGPDFPARKTETGFARYFYVFPENDLFVVNGPLVFDFDMRDDGNFGVFTQQFRVVHNDIAAQVV